jgi:hypothetical protein
MTHRQTSVRLWQLRPHDLIEASHHLLHYPEGVQDKSRTLRGGHAVVLRPLFAPCDGGSQRAVSRKHLIPNAYSHIDRAWAEDRR